MITHIYVSALQAPPGRGYAGCLEWVVLGIGPRLWRILDMNFRENLF